MVPVRLIIKRLRRRLACISDCIRDKEDGADEEHAAPKVAETGNSS